MNARSTRRTAYDSSEEDSGEEWPTKDADWRTSHGNSNRAWTPPPLHQPIHIYGATHEAYPDHLLRRKRHADYGDN